MKKRLFLASLIGILVMSLVFFASCDDPAGSDTTEPPPEAPATPSGLTLSVDSSTSVYLTWSAVTGASFYRVYRSGSSGGTYSLIGSPSSRSFLNTGLTAGATYYYKVSAVNYNGDESAQSGWARITPNSLPSAPSSVVAIPRPSSEIMVCWSRISNASTYRVYRSTSSAGPYSFVGSYDTSQLNSFGGYSNSGTAGTTYYYRVSAVNDAGEGSQSGYASATASATVPGYSSSNPITIPAGTTGVVGFIDGNEWLYYKFTRNGNGRLYAYDIAYANIYNSDIVVDVRDGVNPVLNIEVDLGNGTTTTISRAWSSAYTYEVTVRRKVNSNSAGAFRLFFENQ